MYKNKYTSELQDICKLRKRNYLFDPKFSYICKAGDKLTKEKYKINQSLYTKRIKV